MKLNRPDPFGEISEKFWALLAGDPHQARATALLDFELVGGRTGKIVLTRSGAMLLP